MSCIVPLPKDSTLIIRPRSALGLKYVEITRGSTRARLRRGTTRFRLLRRSRRQSRSTTSSTCSTTPRAWGRRPTSRSSARALPDGASRSTSRSQSLVLSAEKLEPVMRNIADPRTGWDRFFPALEQAASRSRLSPRPRARCGRRWTRRSPLGPRSATRCRRRSRRGRPRSRPRRASFPAQRPFLADSEELFRRFRPAFASLAAAAPGLATAFSAGEPALRRSPASNRRLTRTLRTLERFGDDPRVPSGLARLTRPRDCCSPRSRSLPRRKPSATTALALPEPRQRALGERPGRDACFAS